jgi:UDP-GlcNAc:undecaprenyl-phosphate GlcNAc-1-phosphate transferase
VAIAYQNYFDIALLILTSIIVSIIVTPLSIFVAKKMDIIDYPGRSSHHIHKIETPRAGGIAILFSIIVLFFLFSLWHELDIIKLLIPSLIIFGFGLWDDRFGMDAPVKLLGQLIAVAILIFFEIRVQFFENHDFFIQLNYFSAYWIDIGITVFWMIGITNAFNMVDSMDGLAPGLARILSAFFFLITLISKQVPLIYLSGIIFGISWGINYFNATPAKTFLGDSGAQLLGFLLAAIAIVYYPQSSSQQSSWFVPILFFSVPIFDTTLVTISRIRRGQPFYKANQDHTYHRLIAFGWDSSRAVASMHVYSLLSSLSAIIALYLAPVLANIIFIVWLVVFLSLLFFFERKFQLINCDL